MRPVALLVRVGVTAVALLAAALLVPGIDIAWGDDAAGALVTLVALAVLFGLVNTFVGPIARTLALPLNLLTLGLFSAVVNAALLLLVAFLVDMAWAPLLTIGGFPPDLSLDAVVTAAIGALIISLVSTLMAKLIPEA
ncbi:phage holin family protein [soil metagenome]